MSHQGCIKFHFPPPPPLRGGKKSKTQEEGKGRGREGEEKWERKEGSTKKSTKKNSQILPPTPIKIMGKEFQD